jgi:lipopolysaccharide heptosyltransferase II
MKKAGRPPMKMRAMIRIDALLGLPLCAMLSLLRLPWRWHHEPARDVRRILVIKFIGMGSVVLATPLLRRLRETYPEARITFLTFSSNADFCSRLPGVDDVIGVRCTEGLAALLRSAPGLMLRLRRSRFDVALDLEFYSRLSNLVSWGSGARRRIGFFVRSRWRGSMLTDPVYFNHTLPYGDAVMAQLRPLGIDPGPASPLMSPKVTDAEDESAWARLITLGVPTQGTIVVLNVNSSDLCPERRWSGDRFAELVSRFEREISRVDRFVFIGLESERPIVRSVLADIDPDALPRCLDLSGRTDLLELLVLLKHSALVVTNDSGPLHLAAALGVPTVSLFGPENPGLYGPVGDSHLVFYSNHWCSPCLSVYNAKIAMCGGENECMRRIEVDDVVTRTAKFCRERVGLAPPPQGSRSGQETRR